VRHDFKETLYSFWDLIDADTINAAFNRLQDKGREFLSDEGIAGDRVGFERAIDFRYYGQEYVLTIPLDDGPIDMGKVRADFDEAYKRQYGHNSPENRVEMANIRLASLGRLDRPDNAPPEREKARAARTRDVWFNGAPSATSIIDRNSIQEGQSVSGPAIIEEVTSTTLLPPGWRAQLIEGGHMSLVKEDAA
jgi:N-methylhydantoinase A